MYTSYDDAMLRSLTMALHFEVLDAFEYFDRQDHAIADASDGYSIRSHRGSDSDAEIPAIFRWSSGCSAEHMHAIHRRSHLTWRCRVAISGVICPSVASALRMYNSWWAIR